jgi:inosine-uridine nucleoside N-ribohydrolase
MREKQAIPVILDTDIGGDIDDTWALAMMLKCPELDVKLIVSDTGNTEYRAKLCAKMLERAGRSDIAVGIGLQQESDGPREKQADWVNDYDLTEYPGTVYQDGVDAIIETIENSPAAMTLICIGPVPNIAEALKRNPGIAEKTNFIGMHGSIHKQHGGKEGRIAEYNVVQDIPACQATFLAPWKSMTITPLDTCGLVQLKGSLYKQIFDSSDPIVKDVIENYQIWTKNDPWFKSDSEKESSILFDTVAIHLAYSSQFLKMEKMGIRIDDKGFTIPDPNASIVNVAIDWLDLNGFHDELVTRLLRTEDE